MEKPKKSRRRKLVIWLCVDLTVAAVVFLLLLHKPADYHPVMPPLNADVDRQRVHPYFTSLANALYNGTQDRKPFEIEVIDKSLNEAIAQTGWVQQEGGISLSSPAVAFAPGRVILMATADIEGAEFVVTVEIAPQILEDGRLNLPVEKVKVGAMNITPLAKMMARKMYRERVETGGVDTDDWRTKIAASLLNEEPFDPVFPAEDKWGRLTGLDLAQGKLLARFVQIPKARK